MGGLLWHSGALLLGYTTLLHVIWAGIIFASPIQGSLPTPLFWLQAATGSRFLLIVILVGIASMTVVGLRYDRTTIGLVLMIPQQAVLTISALGAVTTIATGTYPDGYLANPLYIFKDQVGTVLLAPAYTTAMLVFHNVLRGRPDNGER